MKHVAGCRGEPPQNQSLLYALIPNLRFGGQRMKLIHGQLKKMTTQEASQRVRVIQVLAKDVEKEKKVREIRWQTFSKHLRDVIPAEG
jgi:hypothetical protein